MKRVRRRATPQDAELFQKNEIREREALAHCRERVAERNLPMRLVAADQSLDGRKVTFYFTSEGRVDFRELVKDLAQRFHTRIEMRQIGVRDEAGVKGGYGPCGRNLCCSTFLKEFAPVSIRMAKDQNLSLNPSKISGMCGRLMCCLRYEHTSREGAPSPEPATT
jgi:cell fate regulator YaaT (PSP1 superfamily)